MTGPGRVVIVSGPPRAGKTSIARVLQADPEGSWVNLGVDAVMDLMAPHLLPSIGLRPGGERPDLEGQIVAAFAAMYDSVAAFSRHGFDVVVDVCHHDGYTRPLGVLSDAARRLAGLPAVLVAVECPIEVAAERRDASRALGDFYEGHAEDGTITHEVVRWHTATRLEDVDLRLDTSDKTPEQCAAQVRALFAHEPIGGALSRLASW